jgi:hypothetical protein
LLQTITFHQHTSTFQNTRAEACFDSRESSFGGARQERATAQVKYRPPPAVVVVVLPVRMLLKREEEMLAQPPTTIAALKSMHTCLTAYMTKYEVHVHEVL